MSNKLTCVVSAFPDSYSEHGKISIALIEALIAIRGEEWNIVVVSKAVLDSAMGYMDDHEWLLPYVTDRIPNNPDIWIQFSPPQQYVRYGKLINIGFDINHVSNMISKSHIDGINRMDLMIVISDSFKNVIENTLLDHRNSNGEIVATDKVQMPVEVLMPGNSTISEGIKSKLSLTDIKETHCFITNCVWGSGYDINNLSQLLFTFWKTFENTSKKPALILKTNIKASSIIDIDRIKRRIEIIKEEFPNKSKLANVYLINGNLSDQQTMGLYNNPKVKAMVSISSHEIIGANLREFSITRKPIIAPDWGAHVDGLKITLPVETKMVDVDKSLISEYVVEGSKYSYPNVAMVEHYMASVMKYPDGHFNRKLADKPSSQKMQESLDQILTKYISTQTKSKYLPEVEEFEL